MGSATSMEFHSRILNRESSSEIIQIRQSAFRHIEDVRSYVKGTATSEAAMANSDSIEKHSTKIIVGLLTFIGVLLSIIYYDFSGDVNSIATDLKTLQRDGKSTQSEISELRVDVTRELGVIGKEIAVSNTKLDSVIEELRKK